MASILPKTILLLFKKFQIFNKSDRLTLLLVFLLLIKKFLKINKSKNLKISSKKFMSKGVVFLVEN